MAQIKYIGPTQVFQAASLNEQDTSLSNIEVKTDTLYNIDLIADSQVIINGEQFIPPDGTVWVIFIDKSCRVPYSPECLSKHWELDG